MSHQNNYSLLVKYSQTAKVFDRVLCEQGPNLKEQMNLIQSHRFIKLVKLFKVIFLFLISLDKFQFKGLKVPDTDS